MLLQLLLVLHGDLLRIVGLVSESSTVCRQSPPTDDRLKFISGMWHLLISAIKPSSIMAVSGLHRDGVYETLSSH